MAKWFRMRRLEGGYAFWGEWTIRNHEEVPNDHLMLKSDDDWRFIGKKNLQAMLSAQKGQLHEVETARCVAKQYAQKIENLAPGDAEKIEDEETTIWLEWHTEKRSRQIDNLYRPASYICRSKSALRHLQQVVKDYTAIIEEIKATIARLEEVLANTDFVEYEHGTPPIFPWLRTDGYFKEGDKILGWKESHKFSHSDECRLWTPHLDEVLSVSIGVIRPLSGFLDSPCRINSSGIMLVQEAKYYRENAYYRQFLIERTVMSERTYSEPGSDGWIFSMILLALNDQEVFSSLNL